MQSELLIWTMVAIVGTVGVIKNLATKADKILIGGGMAFTFLKAQDKNIGKSLLDAENIDFCKEILSKYSDKIVLPTDFAVTNEYTDKEEYRQASIDEFKDDEHVTMYNNSLGTYKDKIIK